MPAKWMQKAKVKSGKMHEELGVAPSKPISDRYGSGESLAKALIKKVGVNRARKMIQYAANTSSKPIFKAAAEFIKRKF